MPKAEPSPERLLSVAEERLGAARTLFEAGYWADTAGRAYYAMFSAARALLAARKVYPRTHSGVIRRFGLEFVKPGYIAELHGRALASAKEMREEAEYHEHGSVTQEEAEDVLREADAFLETVRKVLRELGSP